MIPTAEEIIAKHSRNYNMALSIRRQSTANVVGRDAKEAMIEFAKLHVEAALKVAAGEAPMHVTEEILSCYPLTNLK